MATVRICLHFSLQIFLEAPPKSGPLAAAGPDRPDPRKTTTDDLMREHIQYQYAKTWVPDAI